MGWGWCSWGSAPAGPVTATWTVIGPRCWRETSGRTGVSLAQAVLPVVVQALAGRENESWSPT